MNQKTEYFASISEVAAKLDVPAHTLRYWEKQFPTAIKPTTGTGGRRYYRPETVDALVQIRRALYDNGMTIAGVKKLIKDGRFPPDGVVQSERVVGMVTTPVAQNTVANGDKANIDHAIALLKQARGLLKPVL